MVKATARDFVSNCRSNKRVTMTIPVPAATTATTATISPLHHQDELD